MFLRLSSLVVYPAMKLLDMLRAIDEFHSPTTERMFSKMA